MSNYEFWDELGKIFNAVVAYQEKSIEFNKRFINPWIRLGNVFEKQDRHKEAIEAYKKAIELDPANAENWFELGNAYFQSEAYDQAADAFHQAIELNPQFGWAYSNLALALTMQGKHEEAIPLYQIGVDLVEEDKDKAVIWNRLGNVYRKLNQYDLAVQAFQKADELDAENAGFRDELDEAEEGPTLVEGNNEAKVSQPAEVELSPIQLIVEESHAEEAATMAQAEATESVVETPATSPEVTEVVAEEPAAVDSQPESSVSTEAQPDAQAENVAEVVAEIESPAPTEVVAEAQAEAVQATDQPATKIAVAENSEQIVEVTADAAVAGQPVEAVSEATDRAAQNASEESITVPVATRKETVTVAVQTTVETFTDSVSTINTSTETTDIIEEPEPQAEETPASEPERETTPEAVESSAPAIAEETSSAEAVSAETTEVEKSRSEVQVEAQAPVSEVKVIHIEEETIVIKEDAEAAEETVAEAANQTQDDLSIADHAAYEEYLKDNAAALNVAVSVDEQTEEHGPALPPEPAAQMDSSGELRIEVDAKNAHVWNELGNVYFNTGEFDDAIVAYSKAIELDRWFAWPYSNLALAYVQKGRFVEAILLYQRSIELFASEKDKAISWNRLGNVYRRLNDYDNAIASYQRADELDPDNTTLSLQSRFSLLGSYAMEPKPSYAS